MKRTARTLHTGILVFLASSSALTIGCALEPDLDATFQGGDDMAEAELEPPAADTVIDLRVYRVDVQAGFGEGLFEDFLQNHDPEVEVSWPGDDHGCLVQEIGDTDGGDQTSVEVKHSRGSEDRKSYEIRWSGDAGRMTCTDSDVIRYNNLESGMTIKVVDFDWTSNRDALGEVRDELTAWTPAEYFAGVKVIKRSDSCWAEDSDDCEGFGFVQGMVLTVGSPHGRESALDSLFDDAQPLE